MNFKMITSFMFFALTLLQVMAASADHNYAKSSDCQDIAGLLIIGEVEIVTFTSTGLRLKARIDTGATTSSLGVQDQQPFERDGKKWLRFSVKDPVNEKYVKFEQPVVRIAEIKRHGAKAQERPVVKLKIMMGDIEMEREFSLTDRSRYTYPVLIGRNVLSGKFLVDVNRKFSIQSIGGHEE